MTRAVFLDRDGVLNHLVYRNGGFFSPQSFSDFRLFDWSANATLRLSQLGLLVIVVTNQPDLSRGAMTTPELVLMHDKLTSECSIDAIYVCPHDQADRCLCRKPKPGMLLRAQDDFNLSMLESWMIGDRESDIEAGIAVGAKTIKILNGQGKSTSSQADFVAISLLEATQIIESICMQ